jgi:hypothetical protein
MQPMGSPLSARPAGTDTIGLSSAVHVVLSWTARCVTRVYGFAGPDESASIWVAQLSHPLGATGRHHSVRPTLEVECSIEHSTVRAQAGPPDLGFCGLLVDAVFRGDWRLQRNARPPTPSPVSAPCGALSANTLEHFHAERNHQGKGNVLLFTRDTDVRREGPVQCRERLGGLLLPSKGSIIARPRFNPWNFDSARCRPCGAAGIWPL